MEGVLVLRGTQYADAVGQMPAWLLAWASTGLNARMQFYSALTHVNEMIAGVNEIATSITQAVMVGVRNVLDVGLITAEMSNEGEAVVAARIYGSPCKVVMKANSVRVERLGRCPVQPVAISPTLASFVPGTPASVMAMSFRGTPNTILSAASPQ